MALISSSVGCLGVMNATSIFSQQPVLALGMSIMPSLLRGAAFGVNTTLIFSQIV